MRIEGSLNGQISASGVSDILLRLNIGDIVRAKVLEITSSELILKLFDGTTLTAAAMSPVDAKKGDLIDLVVKNNINNQLVLETFKSEEQKTAFMENEIKKELVEMNVKPDAKGMEIAREIKSSDIPLNKETFGKVADVLLKFADLTAKKAAYLVSKNIALEDKNISSLNQIVDQKFKIGAQVSELLKSLVSIEDENTRALMDKGLKSLIPHNNVTNLSKTELADKLTQIIPELPEEPQNPSMNKILADDADKSEGAKIKDKIVEFINANKDSIKEPDKLIEHLKSSVKGFADILNSNKEAAEDMIKSLFHKIKNNKTSPDDAVKDIPQRQVFEERFQDTIKKTFEKFFVKISEDTTKDDINIKNIYKDMFEKLEIIKDTVIRSSIPNREEILGKIDNLQNNMRFLNEINNHSTYIQIPLNILNKNTTGELYILKKNQGRKRIDPKNATLFLSLNTQNLGQVDSLVGIDKKNISLNIRVENNDIINFIKENYKDLYMALLHKGYKLVDIKYRLIEEDINVLNVNEVLKNELKNERQSFDCKI
ncbi:MAG: flagellar hook-length control protein FliK [Bacillota bacterium]